MADFIKGTEIKFAVNIEAQGFSMDTDDFDLEVITPRESVKGYKNPPQGTSTDLVVFKETVTPEEGDPVSTWYAILDTTDLTIGQMRVVATAHIPDANANDGIRNEISVARLGKLIDK